MGNLWEGMAEAAFVTFFMLAVIYRVQIWNMVADADYRVWQHKSSAVEFRVSTDNPNRR